MNIVQRGDYSQLTVLRERATEARSSADLSNLPNVRKRWLDAAAAWDAMADRVQKTEDSRKAKRPEQD